MNIQRHSRATAGVTALVILAVHLALGATALLAAARWIGAAALGIIVVAAALHIGASRARRRPPPRTQTAQAQQHRYGDAGP